MGGGFADIHHKEVPKRVGELENLTIHSFHNSELQECDKTNFSAGGYSALKVLVLCLFPFSSAFNFLSCNLRMSDLMPPGVRVLR